MGNRKTILTQHGALGDFLLAWPGMLAVTAHMAGQHEPVLWAGPLSCFPLLEPLGVRPADRPIREAVTACYSAQSWPAPLGEARLFWFCLERCPVAEPLAGDARLHCIPILQGTAPPALTVSSFLHRHGIAKVEDPLAAFRRCFGPHAPATDAPVLLFPGSGHPRKCWPRPRFLELAEQLGRRGQKSVLVLGPNEQEQGWDRTSLDIETATPQSLMDLLALLRGCRAVVGNDSGPMHLAGMLGVPGVALFGPTDPGQWGPQGESIRILCDRRLQCRPCSRHTRDLACPQALCLEALTVRQVLEAMPI
ncbi:glycosyltransferase family 9 protein [Megalodesulfovibrio paquesii]